MNELDNQQSALREIALFAGVGGGILGGKLLGWETVCAVERDLFAASVLAKRQNDGLLSPFPIWSDVQTFDGKPWRGIVDVVSGGGFPVRTSALDIQEEKDSKDSDLECIIQMLRIVKEVEPTFVFIENVGNIRARGIEIVREGLSDAGYRSVDGDFFASDCGSPHPRKRTFILAWREWERVVCSIECDDCSLCGEPVCWYCSDHFADCDCRGAVAAESQGFRLEQRGGSLAAYTYGSRCQEQRRGKPVSKKLSPLECAPWWEVEPRVVRLVDGGSFRVDRIRGLGNIQVPAVAAIAFSYLEMEMQDVIRKEAYLRTLKQSKD